MPRAVTLRIKRGAKVLSDVKIGRSRVLVGSGKHAQLRLKNAGLAEECLILDTRSEPFGIESKLGPDEIRVNGRPILSSQIHIGDVIELAGLSLELLESEPREASDPARAGVPRERAPSEAPRDRAVSIPPRERAVSQPPRPRPPEPASAPAEASIDPYMGQQTAARVKQADIERAREALRKKAAPVAAEEPPARPVVVAESAPQLSSSPSQRPPWLELVGDDQVADARLYLKDGAVAGRQGDLRVRHPSVSKRHARFTIEGGKVFVEDLGSTNGVWINRERIPAKRPIVEGDTLHLGAVEFAVRIPEGNRDVTTLGPPPREPSMPSMPAARLDESRDRSATLQEAPAPRGAVPQELRERRTETEGVRRADVPARALDRDTSPPSPSTRRPTDRETESPLGRRPTDREQGSPFSGADRLTEREGGARSPWDDDLDGRVATGTGRPGRHDATENELPAARREKSARLAAAPPSPAPRSPTPSMLFGDVSLGESESGLQLDVPAVEPPKREKSAAIVTKAPVAVPARDALRDEDFVPPRRRSAGKLLGVAFLGIVMGALGVGALALWPRITDRLQSTASPPGDTLATAPERAAPSATKKPREAKAGKTPRVEPNGIRPATPVAVTAPDIEVGGGLDEEPKSIFDGAPVDLRSDGRLDRELASLEKDSAEKGLRAERAIGAEELKSIFLSEETAVVRKLYKDDGFDREPSAADEDPRDAEAKRQGAKQLDPEKVNRLIREKFPAVKKCLVGASVKRGKARVVVEFTIQPNGKTENVSVVDSDISGSSFKSCVTGVVRGIKFPKPKDQSVVVQFPFVFTYN